MKLHLSIAALALVAVGACSAPPPAPVTPEPTFDKLGEGTCPEGYTYIPGALYEGTCEPEDQRRPDRPDDDDDDRPRDPYAGINPQ